MTPSCRPAGSFGPKRAELGIYNDHVGIRLDALTAAQRTAALAVLQTATGTTANEGFDEIQQLRAAADSLAVASGSFSGIMA